MSSSYWLKSVTSSSLLIRVVSVGYKFKEVLNIPLCLKKPALLFKNV